MVSDKSRKIREIPWRLTDITIRDADLHNNTNLEVVARVITTA